MAKNLKEKESNYNDEKKGTKRMELIAENMRNRV